MSDPRTTTRRDGPDLPLRQAGPYQLLAIVGHGRGGTVFLARRPGIERNFALKLLPPGLDPEAEARALREARLASRLAHPGFARVLEIDRHQDRLYVVMEHVPGPTLRELVERGGPMASPEAAELVAELAESLEAAHRAGVLHRDVSPQNVVLDDRTGRPRLVDFGLACEDGDGGRLTRPGEGLGTPDAAAPELLRGDPVDARADVYGLGVVLYELLAGARPFEGPAADVVRAVLSLDPADRPPPPSARAPGVDRQVEAACLRAMAPSPEDRFASAGDLARALAAPRAAPARPRRGALALAAVTSLALLVAAAAAWLDARAELASRRAAAEAATSRLDAARAALRRAEDEGAAARAALADLDARRVVLARARDDARAALAADNTRAQLRAHGWAEPAIWVPRGVDALVRWLEPHPAAAAVRAELHLDRGRPAPGLEAARQARDAALEARALAQLDRRDEARALVAALLRDAPPGDPARRFAQLVSGDPAALADVSDDAPVPLLVARSQRLAAEALQRQDPQGLSDAARLADVAVRRWPTSVEALYARSAALYHRWLLTREPALVPRFMADLRRARAVLPQPMFWVYAGKAHVQTDRPIEALGELQRALVLADQQRDGNAAALGRVWLGAALTLLGDQAQAVAAWVDALRVAPDAPGVYDFLPWARRLPPPHQARLLEAVPPARRAEVQRLLAERG